MTSCLENIVSVKDLCPSAENTPSSSGYDIWDAPEIKYKGVAAVTDSKYIKGREVLLAVRERAIRELEGDFLKSMLSGGYSINTGTTFYQAAIVDTANTNPPAPQKRGITIRAVSSSPIRKLKIRTVSVFPVNSLTTELKIWDNGLEYAFPIQLTAGVINDFALDFTASGDLVRIYIDNTDLTTYSSAITCMIGCNGTKPNDCGYVTGWNGTNEVSREGFGISASFGCECNYSALLCSWSKSFIGKILWLKMRAFFQEEVINSERLNSFTIYNREEAKEKMVDFENEYRAEWNSFVNSLPGILKNFYDSCLTCKRTSTKTNI